MEELNQIVGHISNDNLTPTILFLLFLTVVKLSIKLVKMIIEKKDVFEKVLHEINKNLSTIKELIENDIKKN